MEAGTSVQNVCSKRGNSIGFSELDGNRDISIFQVFPSDEEIIHYSSPTLILSDASSLSFIMNSLCIACMN